MLKTSGEIEADVATALSRFERDHMGRGPKASRAYLVEDVILVRLAGILSVAEKTLSQESGGVDSIKQLRTRLIEAAEDQLKADVEEAAGVAVASIHSDLSTRTGERVFVFVLEGAPRTRDGG